MIVSEVSSVSATDSSTRVHSQPQAVRPGRVRPGQPFPLGATPDSEGVNFAIFSENATSITLCLYDATHPEKETEQIELTERTEFVWHCYVEGLTPGQLYGYRVDGPWVPQEGHYFNPCKLLLDPYARAVSAPLGDNNDQLGYEFSHDSDERFLIRSEKDSGPTAPKCVVVAPDFDWEDDARPNVPLSETVFYEMHVKGLSINHPTLKKKVRGTYAALGSPEIIDYLKKLGVTSVELLPIHQFSNESYWGYNTVAFFAPHNGYASAGIQGQQVNEFKQMVKNLHKAGIEVILDVVYNHTAEGNQFGPTLSLKGIDNRNYYRTVPGQQQYYMDHTGTGNTLDITHPRTLQLVMDSLRYWVEEMHVDGFRFDLAATLIRDSDEENGRFSSFLDTVGQDPVLAKVKLVAEPWDIGSYQVGNFPVQWAEWNGRYRDCVRMYWKGDEGKAHEMSCRVLGSPDLYHDGRGPAYSVNLITAHDGFTLNDLVSYNDKHNEANGEDNRDGANDNESWNMGAEGETNDPAIRQAREQQKRNFLLTMFASQGTPMLLMGDEYGRTQRGNNNTYNQDNDLNYQDWRWTAEQQAQFDFAAGLAQLRREIPLLRYRKFFQHGQIQWLTPGPDATLHPIEGDEWHDPNLRCIALFIDGENVEDIDNNGQPIPSDKLLFIMNSHWEERSITLTGGPWHVLADTATGQIRPDGEVDRFVLAPRASVLLLRQ